jgi:hypothetical protein
MKRAIFKITLSIKDGVQVFSLPGSVSPVFVAEQHGRLCVWCAVQPDEPETEIKLTVFGTGQEYPPLLAYVGSAICGQFVWHVLWDKS